ncbi:unnamed protein product, partial [Mesorhabditis spiculigera]
MASVDLSLETAEAVKKAFKRKCEEKRIEKQATANCTVCEKTGHGAANCGDYEIDIKEKLARLKNKQQCARCGGGCPRRGKSIIVGMADTVADHHETVVATLDVLSKKPSFGQAQ